MFVQYPCMVVFSTECTSVTITFKLCIVFISFRLQSKINFIIGTLKNILFSSLATLFVFSFVLIR